LSRTYAPSQNRVGERNQGERGRRQREVVEVVDADVGELEGRQASLHCPNRGHPVGGEIEDLREHDREAMTTSDPGRRGANRRNASSSVSSPALNRSVARFASPSSCTRMRKKSVAETEMPSSFGS
jgi:hypothetical protein